MVHLHMPLLVMLQTKKEAWFASCFRGLQTEVRQVHEVEQASEQQLK